VPVLIGAVMIFSGIKLAYSLHEYKVAGQEYEALQTYVKETPVATVTTSEEDVQETEVEESVIPPLEVDVESLMNINEDYKGWLVIPALDISYPYVQGKDNEEYLHQTFEHTKNSAGTVFMDAYNYSNFMDYNTFLYAHNMKDKSMFGSLKQLAKDPSLIEDNPYIYVYTPKGAYRFEIFAYYVTYKKSNSYQIISKTEEYDKYIDYIASVNKIENEKTFDFSSYPRILTLSTCYGSAGTSNRYVVHAVLTDQVKYD